MVLIQLLLPVVEDTDPNAPFAQTRQELAMHFTGLTAYVRSPAKGLWNAPDGHTEQDNVVMVEVVTEQFDREWWRSYANVLAQRFQQNVIHVRALAIEMLDQDA